MAKAQTLRIDGDKALRQAFLTLGPKVGRKVIRKALQKSLKPTLDDAKRRAAQGKYATGFSAANIKIRAALKRSNGRIALEVRVGEGDFSGKTFYAAMREYGTKKQPARPFMRPAFEAHKDQALRVALLEIKAGVIREARAK